MGLLFNEFNSLRNDKKSKVNFQSASTPFAFPTGFDLLDHRNGKIIRPRDGAKPYMSLGFDEGTYIMVVGKSGCGKTTFCIQAAASIVAPYEEGMIIHDDIEVATNSARIKALTGWSDEEIEAKYMHRQVGITAESFHNNLKAIAMKKMELADQLRIKTDRVNSQGEPIYILPPTVYILDSLALLVPDKIAQEEEISGSMSQTAVAKANSMVFSRILPYLRQANIILLVVNHINQKIEINPMVHTQAQVNYLGADESIPGGNKPIYLANNILKIVTGSKLIADKEFGFDGFMAKVVLIKSRSNKSGQSVELVYDQSRGFMNHCSNFEYLRKQEILGGSGSGYFIKDLPDFKVKKSNFEERFKESREFRSALRKAIRSAAKQFVVENDKSEHESEEAANAIAEPKAKPKKKKSAK